MVKHLTNWSLWMLTAFLPSLPCLAAARVEFISPEASDVPSLKASWIREGDDAWLKGPPAVSIGTGDPSSRIWIAADAKGVRLRVIVQDQHHLNTRTGASIWDGDALQIGFDALGAGAGARGAEAAFVGPVVSSITYALTENGPQAWAHHHGRAGAAGARPDLAPRIQRDEAQHTTTYDLLIPWTDYELQPGVAGVVGIAVQVNDTDSDEGESQKRISLGQGAGGVPRPGLFRRIAVEPPPSSVAGLGFLSKTLWREGDAFDVVIATGETEDAVAVLTIGQEKAQSIKLPVSPVARRILRVWPAELPIEPLPVQVSIMSGEKTIASASCVIDAPGRYMDELDRRLRTLAMAADSERVARHFSAVRAVFAEEWIKAMQYARTNPEMASECVAFARKVLGRLDQEPEGFAAGKYAGGGPGMVHTFLAEDGTLQFYHVSLPKGFDPLREYPLIVYLHGHGNSHPLHSIANAFESRDPRWAEAETLEPAIRISPWARGNYGYRDIAESDVFRAMADTRRVFRIKEDRVYLMGHSMGGAGTWAIASRHPDVWAAIGICSGSMRSGTAENLQSLPVVIWHGDTDRLVPLAEAYRLQKALASVGNAPQMVVVKGRGHDMDPADDLGVVKSMLQHRRKRPDSFTYRMTSSGPRGIWGVMMRRPRNAAPEAELRCTIKSGTVHLTVSDGTALSISLGVKGLGLDGMVRVNVNGKLRYSGPAEDVEIPAESSQ